MRALGWIVVIVGASLGAACGASPPPPAEPMPLPPIGDEARREAAPAGDDHMRVFDLDPRSGPARGGNAVRIRGANFRNATGVKVTFNQAEAPVLRMADDEVDVQAPGGSPGELVDVTLVFQPGDNDLHLPGAYTYLAD